MTTSGRQATSGRRVRLGTRHRRAPIGLRARITLSFGLGMLVLSGAFAAITYATTSSSLIAQKRSTIEQQAVANAYVARSAALSPSVRSFLQVLTQLDQTAGTTSFVHAAHRWYTGNAQLTPQSLPPAFLAAVDPPKGIGAPVEQVFNLNDRPQLAVGIPLPFESAIYVGVFDLSGTASSLRALLVSLVAIAALTTVAGAVLGRWAAGRALRPLRNASHAALSIASGQLDTRLESADVSDLAVLASSFNRMADRLQARIERDARFTSDVSHELRSPLTVLANSVSVLEARRDELPERSQRALDLVAAEVRRFQRMVADLLEISRIDAGSAELEVSVVEVGELVRRVASAIGRPSLQVEMTPEVASLRVAVDKRRFERVIANLVDNADRYAGGPSRLAVEGGEGVVRLAVEDQGPGVAPADRQRIFERFARGSSAAGSRGTGGGTGLGLALVAEHVKLHGGRVWVEDRPGGGARFVVELPTAASAAAPQPSGVAGTPDDLESDEEAAVASGIGER